MKKRIAKLVATLATMLLATALGGCNSAILLGRTGDDLETADTYALCKARRSAFASQAVIDAIRRRQIDCGYWDRQITNEDAARRAAMFQAGAQMMTQPVVAPPPRPTTTTCNRVGDYVNCTTY